MNILPQKFIFSPRGEKIVKKFPPIFHFQGWKSFLIYTFLGKNFQDWLFFGKNLQFFGKNGKNLQILGGKSIKIGIFWVKSFPPIIFFPPLLLFGRIFTYGSLLCQLFESHTPCICNTFHEYCFYDSLDFSLMQI